jgi:hypothetical protein
MPRKKQNVRTGAPADARIRDGTIVTFRLPPRSTVYALKSENAAHWKAAARAHRARNGTGDPSIKP